MGRTRKPRPAGLAGQLGERIEAVRKARGWTAEELAVGAGVGRGTVLRIEAGSVDAGIGTVRAVARALGLSGAELLSACPDWEVSNESQPQPAAGPESAKRRRGARRA